MSSPPTPGTPSSPLCPLSAPRTIGDYSLGRLLGCGGFGKVFACTHTRTGQAYAMKIIERSFIEQHDISSYVRKEVEMLKRLHHKHVVGFVRSIETEEAVHIVMELATHGELFDKIIMCKKFEESVARTYFQQLISAIAACHSMGICHRDLKAENLLLDEDDNLKVCDFGLCVVSDAGCRQHSVTGSMEYQPPEMIDPTNDLGYDSRSADVWSSGVILCFMLQGFLPFNGKNEHEIATSIRGEPKIADHVSPPVRALILRILHRDAAQRAKLAEIIEDPWFNEGHTINLENMFPEHESPKTMSRVESFDEAQTPANCPHMARIAFETMDLHHSGRLMREDILNVMLSQRHGAPIPSNDIDDVFLFFDRKKRGAIYYDDFLHGYLVRGYSGALGSLESNLGVFAAIDHVDSFLLNKLRDVFRSLDRHSTGLVGRESLVGSDEAIQNTINNLTCLHKNQRFTFEEFVVAVTELRGTSLRLTRQIRTTVPGLACVASALDVRRYGHAGFTASGFREEIRTRLMSSTSGGDGGGKLLFVAMGQWEYLKALFFRDGSDATTPSCVITVALLTAQRGYTKVVPSRVSGPTLDYHEAFTCLLTLLDKERSQAHEDTEAIGESELI